MPPDGRAPATRPPDAAGTISHRGRAASARSGSPPQGPQAQGFSGVLWPLGREPERDDPWSFCPRCGGAFAATEAKLFLYSSAGQLLTSTTVPFGDLGSWAGSLRIPAGAANGTTFVVRARCTNAEGVMAQAYGPATFTVTGAARGLGGGRPSGPRLLGARSRCTKPKRSRKLCTYTFTYAVKTASSQPAIATVTLGAHHRRVIARGHVRRHRLTLVFGHLRRGRYRLTLLALDAHGRTATIGRTTIQIS